MKSVGVFFIIGLIAVSAAAGQERQVSVSGDCFRSVTPDRGAMTLTAEVTDPKAGVASQKVIDQYGKIRDRVKKLGLKNLELETVEFTVNEDFEWVKNERKSRGFRARMGLRVTTSEATRMGEVASIASELKVQSVSGLENFVSNELMRSERESCLEEAFKNARNKATILAKSAGLKLGPALQILEFPQGGNPGPQPLFAGKMMAMDEASGGSAPPQIETGTTKMAVTVKAVFDLL